MKISRVLLMLLLAGASNAEDRSSALLSSRLQQRKVQYSIQAENFLQAVAQFASENEIPLGLEWTEDDATLKPVNLSWHNVAVAEILRGLVKNEPGYESTVDRGVVHIFQSGRMAPNRDFLTVPIELFDVKDDYVRN